MYLFIHERANNNLQSTDYGLDGPGIESWWGRDFPLVQTGPGAHPVSCTMGTGSFLGVKSGRGVTLTTHPLLVPWSRKGRAILLLTLWAVRPVQSLGACTRVHFTVTLFSKHPNYVFSWYTLHNRCQVFRPAITCRCLILRFSNVMM